MSWIPRNRVVVPVDFSEESLAALDEARKFVEDVSHLSVIHVLAPLSPNDPAVVWNTQTEALATSRAEETLRHRLEDLGCTDSEAVIRVGNPGAEIAAHAERIGADLIILPSHGRTGLSRLLIGSVAERVVRLAHCPVLVLRNGGAS